MDSPERSRNHVRREKEDNLETRNGRAGEDEEWEGSDKRKHRSSKSRKPSNGEENEGLDGGGRRRSAGDRNEGRKRSGGSSRVDSDDDDYDARKELHTKQLKRKQEESISRHQDGEHESRADAGDKSGSGSRGQGRSDESERRKVSSKFSDIDSSWGRKNKEERSHDAEFEKSVDRDSRHVERKDSSRERTHGSSEVARSSRKRWDESDSSRRSDENYYDKDESRGGKTSDSKHEISKERSRNETSDSKSRGLDLHGEKGGKYNNREERKVESEKGKSKSRLEAPEEDNRASPANQEDRVGRDKHEKHREHRTAVGQDVTVSREKTTNTDEDGNSLPRDKNAREVSRRNRSRTPERSVRHHQESEHSEMENVRSLDSKRKELDRSSHRDDRPKSRDDDWGDRFKDREGSKENWKRRPLSSNDKELRDGDIFYDRSRDWELPRHGRDRSENERPHGRSGNRKDGNRGEAVKTSSNFGISKDNYDVIEIQTKPLDYRRAESVSIRRSEVGQQSDTKLTSNEEEWSYLREDRGRKSDMYGSRMSGDIPRDEYVEDGISVRDLNSRGAVSGRSGGGQSSVGGSQPPFTPQDPGNYGRAPQGIKGNRLGRGGRGRPTGRDSQQVGLPMPMIGSPFGHLGMPPPGPMQSLPPGISPAPGPPTGPGVFLPPFSPPVVWPGPRGVDMNILGVPPGLSPVPPGPSGPWFPPNMATPPNPGLYFNQSGPGRVGPLNASGPGFTGAGPTGRGMASDKAPGDWVPPRTGGAPGKAPSRGEQNDYSQNFVDTGMRPQNFIRELELTNVVEDYPKLRELIQKKDEIVTNSASPPMYFKCNLREFELSSEFFGTKFDVILIDPPWEEYVHRAPGVADHIEYWTFEEIMNLKIEAIADTPSFIFLWVGDGVGLEQGRQCLKKWGFRRCEDICWVKTNKTNATPGLQHDSHTIFQHSKEHCLMGIKGTVRRSTDGHIIHANIDTDVIIAEEPPYGSTKKPEDMYRIIEHFSLGRRRLELFGEDHNIRSGWLTVGKGLSSSNFNSEGYIRNFADKDGKVWLGGGGRNPPPDAPHLVKTTLEIESLRPKSPMKNQQQMQQQQSTSISLTTANSSSRRATANSPQNPGAFGLNQEASSSNLSMPAPWASPREGFRGRDGASVPPDDRMFDMYGYGAQPNGDFLDFESQRQMNIM